MALLTFSGANACPAELLEQFAICQEETGDKTALSHAAAAGVSQRLGEPN